MSVADTLLFHFPFFNYAAGSVENGFNGIFILVCLSIIMLACNYFAFYLILYLGRSAGKALLSFIFIANAVSLYFINTYDVMIDDSMMGNVFNTKLSEASGYWSLSALAYILILGIVPCIYIWVKKVDYGSLKRFFASIGFSLLAVAAPAFANMSNWTWVDKNSTVGGSLILPWSYIVNTFRYTAQERERNREEILLPDAVIYDNDREVMVLVIGESARRDHFSLYGYGRNTNPRLSEEENVVAFRADADATYTIGGVKAILDHKKTGKLYEILPNYLFRNGVGVMWRTTNWGQPPLHIEKYQEIAGYDENLLEGLSDAIRESGKEKVLAVLHTSTSHGPSYDKKYPPEFEVFSPVCNTVEMSKCPHDELVNSYDNSIVYTDWLLYRLIEELKGLEGWRCGMIYVSDHGESLGENNLYMHGLPMSVAPAEQYEIPFIVWTSDGSVSASPEEKLSQYNVFHSVLHFLGIDSPVYDGSMNIFE